MTPLPKLDRPVLIAAFEGWNDAGDAASGAVEHLELTWDATLITEVDSDDFYDFQVKSLQSLLTGTLSVAQFNDAIAKFYQDYAAQIG